MYIYFILKWLNFQSPLMLFVFHLTFAQRIAKIAKYILSLKSEPFGIVTTNSEFQSIRIDRVLRRSYACCMSIRLNLNQFRVNQF